MEKEISYTHLAKSSFQLSVEINHAITLVLIVLLYYSLRLAER